MLTLIIGKQNPYPKFLYSVAIWAINHPTFLTLLKQSYRQQQKWQLYTLLEENFRDYPAAKTLSDLLALAMNSWINNTLYENLRPLFVTILEFQELRNRHRNEHAKISYNLYLSLPPQIRDKEYLPAIPQYEVSKLQLPYPPLKHYIYESEPIKNLWQHYLEKGKQPDLRLPRYPLSFLDPGNLQFDLTCNKSAVFRDPANGEIVGMVIRNFLPSTY